MESTSQKGGWLPATFTETFEKNERKVSTFLLGPGTSAWSAVPKAIGRSELVSGFQVLLCRDQQPIIIALFPR